MPKFTRSAWFLVVAAACWLVLLLSALNQRYALAGLPGSWPTWLLLLAQGGAATGVFLFARTQPDALRGHNFVLLLRQVFWRGLLLTGGLLATMAIEYLTAQRTLLLPGNTTSAVCYTVAVALFILLLAEMLYAWRSLIVFRGARKLQRAWSVFEVLLGVALLFQLFTWHLPYTVQVVIVTGLAVFGVYLSGHQRWVTYLSQGHKVQAVLLQLGVLGFLLAFLRYFTYEQANSALLAPASQQAFLVLASAFAVFYTVTGLLVTFFNLPTADVFEQRRNEILSLQQLGQIIQRGQSPAEICQALFTSATNTVQADAAWLDSRPQLADPSGSPAETLYFNLTPVEVAQLRPALAPLLADGQQELIDNDLQRSRRLMGLDYPFQSAAVLALHSQGFDYGSLVLLKHAVEGFDKDDISILTTFTTQTVLSLENVQLAQESRANQRTQDELRIAALVQERLIPKKLPTDNWFEISTYAQAAKEVGGDFYDFLHLPGQKLAVLIGDVSGKGVTAAFHTAQMKGIFHALMQANPLAKNDRNRYPDPHRFMVQANEALTHCLERSSFITASFYLIDYQAGGFSFARAGHCHTLYYHSIKEEISYFSTEGLGLGIIRDASYEKHVKTQFWDYNPGDVMVIYTDGIVEARDGDKNEYGEDRLRDMLGECFYQSAEEINNYIRRDVQEFSKGQPLHDDQTLLVIKFKAAQPQP
ncbi:MAG: GAF domain-containing SpoIIE family protein phosphatase [Janthinobacterium lividum]